MLPAPALLLTMSRRRLAAADYADDYEDYEDDYDYDYDANAQGGSAEPAADPFQPPPGYGTDLSEVSQKSAPCRCCR